MAVDLVPPHAQHRAFGVLAIGDEAPVEGVAGAFHVGQQRRDQPAGAAFGGRDLQSRVAARLQQARGGVLHILGQQRRQGLGVALMVLVALVTHRCPTLLGEVSLSLPFLSQSILVTV